MAITAVVTLIVVAYSTAITAAMYTATADQREINAIVAHQNQLYEEIDNTKLVIEELEQVKIRLTTAIEYLMNARDTFKDGGCSYPKVPFSTDINLCLSELRTARTGIETEISRLNSNISDYYTTIYERQRRIDAIKEEMARQKAASEAAAQRNQEYRGRGLTTTSSAVNASKNATKPKHR